MVLLAETSTAGGFGFRVTFIVHPIVFHVFFPVRLTVKAVGFTLTLALGIRNYSYHVGGAALNYGFLTLKQEFLNYK
jgi:hypothetical protein